MIHDYEIVSGLEVHAQLLTKTKLFCGDTTSFGQMPNTQVSAISLGHPGTLPRLNAEAIYLAVKIGLACNCTIVQHNFFARKNYFYPDLPKGYQVTQHTAPICKNGFIEIVTGGINKRIRLNRIHIEEDAGKSIHNEKNAFSDLDYNRAGMPLLEIVTEPDIRSAEEAFAFVSTLRKLVRHLGVCDGNMEEGSFRCDVNISLRKKGDAQLGTRVEVKNLNSLRFIRKSIEHESVRLAELLEKGESILQQTRGFNENDFTTYAIRTKEDEDDYRYFPEPDLPPIYLDDETIEKIRMEMPASQQAIKSKLVNEFKLSDYDASQLADDSELSSFFLELTHSTGNFKSAANWVSGPIKNHLQKNEIIISDSGLKAASVSKLISLIDEGNISHGVAVQQILPVMFDEPDLDVEQFIKENDLGLQTNTDDLENWVNNALTKHAQKIPEYKKGKKGLLSVFVGEVMKLSKGRADAQLVTKIIIKKINNTDE